MFAERIINIISQQRAFKKTFNSEQDHIVMGNADTRYLSSEVAGGFTGVMIGLYAVDEHKGEAMFADLNIEHIEA